MNRKNTTTGIVIIAATAAVLAGCSSRQGSTSTIADSERTNQDLAILQRVQPIPQFPWSQYRQTIIDVETAEANGTATTSFFYNQGVDHPIFSCPSIGFPVPITSQLTNPDQIQYGNRPGGGNDAGVVGQAEPNGTYTGDSTGTYVTCIGPTGAKYYKYWEGFVGTDGGPAHFDPASKTEVLDGPATVSVKEK
jgi:hypothetical protein